MTPKCAVCGYHRTVALYPWTAFTPDFLCDVCFWWLRTILDELLRPPRLLP